MTYQMTRLRLRSIGHADSRYRDLTIPLCDPHGKPVDALLWLANGGGKTSLLSLLFALVLPLRRDFMGADDQERALEEYVQKGDTSHLLIEWADLDAGLPGLEAEAPRLVTGMVHEWAGRVAPADRAADKHKLASTYYAFTSVQGTLTLDSLPVLGEGGTPRTLRDYTEQLKEISRLAAGVPGLEIFQKRNPWADYLEESLGIDPGLYRYQVRMNSAEGAVAKLFRFRSSREFIEFLVEFTAGQGGSASRTLETTTDNVRTLLGKLAARPQLAIEQKFSVAAAERLLAVHEAGAAQAAAAREQRAAQERSAVASASLVEAADRLEREGQRTRESAGGVDEHRRRSTGSRDEALALAAQYELVDARIAVAEATAERDAAHADAIAAALRDDAWRAVPTLVDLTELETDLELWRERLAAETASGLPLRRRHDAAASALRTRLAEESRTAEARAEEFGRELTRTRTRREELARELIEAQQTAARGDEAAALNTERAGKIRKRAADEAGSGDVRAWRTEPVPVSGSGLADAAAEAGQDEQREQASAARRSQEAGAARGRRAELAALIESLNAELRGADKAAAAATASHREAQDALSLLASHDRIRDLAELDEDDALDLHATGESLRARLVELSRTALAEFAGHAASAGTHEAVLAAVSASGYAPAAGDTLEAVRAVTAAGYVARPGWEVLRELVADPAALARLLRSDEIAVVAAGVVVGSADLAAVTALLGRGELTTAAMVAVLDRPAVVAAVSGEDVAASGPRLRVPADPSLYDRDAAVDAQVRHERQAERARESAARARTAAEADAELAARLGDVLDRFPAHEVARLEAEVARAATELQQVHGRVDAANEEQRSLTGRLDELGAAVRDAEAAARTARLARKALERAAEYLADAAEHEAAATAAAEGGRIARARAERIAELVATTEAELDELDTQRRDAAAAAAQLAEESERIRLLGAEDPAPTVTDEPIETLRSRYLGLSREWEAQTSASEAAKRLREGEERRTSLRSRLPSGAGVVAAAEALLAGPEGATPASRAAAARRAQGDAAQSQRREATADIALRAAELEAEDRTPRDRASHASLPDRPETRAAARAGAATAHERAASFESSIEQLRTEHEALSARAERGAGAAASLRHQAHVLDAGRQSAAGSRELLQMPSDPLLVSALLGLDGETDRRAHDESALTEGAAVAEEEVQQALEAEREHGEAAAAASERVGRATSDLRRLGNSAEYKDIPDTIRNRVLAADPAELLTGAERLAADLRQRAMLIGQQLGDLSADTDLVVSRLVTAVRDVMADLGKAERYARMPADTGTWSDRSFLTIRSGPTPDVATVTDRLRPVLERFAGSPDTLVPMTLLKECVLAGAGGPQAFRVKVLKPNAPGQEPEDITKLQKFSGGEKLTVCVALYCVLARLRAHNAGREGGGGTLVLDNPLGTASHTRLLSLQRKVAAAHGVQLVYATGVNDLGAVGEFAHRVRLRKTWHAAIGRSYVDVDDPTEITGAHVSREEP